MDIVIAYHEKDNHIINYCINGIKNIKNARRIYCISKQDYKIQGTVFINESIFPFSKQDIAKYVGEDRAGWYFQQLLKLYSYKYIENLSDTFLVLDSDIVFISPVQFLDENKLPLYGYGGEYWVPYFNHISKVIPGLTKQNNKSGICNHMVFQKKYISEIIEKVESLHSDIFWKIMMKYVDPTEYNRSGMSEYELYFNYMIKFHSDQIKIRELRWANIDAIEPCKLCELSSLSDKFDFIAIHNYMFDLLRV